MFFIALGLKIGARSWEVRVERKEGGRIPGVGFCTALGWVVRRIEYPGGEEGWVSCVM